LIKEGYSSKVLRRHKTTIKNYVFELGAKGALDELPHDEPELNLEVPAGAEVTPEVEATPEAHVSPEAKVTIEPSNLESTVEVTKAVIAEAEVAEAEIVP
jgi:hypothetical protein